MDTRIIQARTVARCVYDAASSLEDQNFIASASADVDQFLTLLP